MSGKQAYEIGEGRALKSALLAEYGHFADRRIKNIDRASRFLVDDRDHGGLASDGQPYGWFCEVIVDVLRDDKISVTLRGQIPQGNAVQAWMTKHNVQISRPFYREQMTFEVGRGIRRRVTNTLVQEPPPLSKDCSGFLLANLDGLNSSFLDD
jgi:hypothetical protein